MGLETVEILMDLEDLFQVRIPDDVASACVTVGDLQAEIVELLLLRGDGAKRDETVQKVWDGMMEVLAQNGYDVSQIRPESNGSEISRNSAEWSKNGLQVQNKTLPSGANKEN
jgi:hypothetical protein